MLVVDKSQHLDVRRDRRLREVVEQAKNLAASREVAEGEFAGHSRVRQHLSVLEKGDQLGFGPRISRAETGEVMVSAVVRRLC